MFAVIALLAATGVSSLMPPPSQACDRAVQSVSSYAPAIGQSLTVRIDVGPSCAHAPLHLGLVIDTGRIDLATGQFASLQAATSDLVRATLRVPGSRVAAFRYDTKARLLWELSADAGLINLAIDMMSPSSDGLDRSATAVAMAHAELARARGGEARESIVLLTHARTNPDVAAANAKVEGIKVAGITFGPLADPLLQSATSGPEWYTLATSPPDLLAAARRLPAELTARRPTQTHLVQALADSVTYVDQSAEPGARQVGNYLSWRLQAAGGSVSFKLRANALGDYAPVAESLLVSVDERGWVDRREFDAPHVHVGQYASGRVWLPVTANRS
jgi:hypothetical protein